MHTSHAASAASTSDTSSSPADAAIVETRVTEIIALADDALIDRIDSLSRLERCNTLENLLHLLEVDRRKLWRALEFRSMYDYCIRRLRYSEAAASRRIRTARLIGRYPRVYHRIREGRLSLCAVSKIARAVLDDGRADLIQQIEGKRLDQVDAILATHRNPERPVRESIRLLCVERRADDPQVTAPPLEASPPRLDDAKGNANVSAPAEAVPGAPQSAGPPAAHGQNDGRKPTRIERVFRFQFGIDADTMTKFTRVQSIAARRAGHHVDLSDLFAVLCDVYLHRYDAATRAERSRTGTSGGRNARPADVGPGDGPESSSRRVPDPVRDTVIRRDGGRCTFVDRNGERCTETVALQIDHVRPYALGGSNDFSNLRAMCAAHNRLLAERTFGRSTVERAVATARDRTSDTPDRGATPSPES